MQNTLSEKCSEFCKKQQEMSLNIPLKSSNYKIFTDIYKERKKIFVENEIHFLHDLLKSDSVRVLLRVIALSFLRIFVFVFLAYNGSF